MRELSTRLRKEEGERAGSAPGTTTDERDEERSEERKNRLVCGGCRHPITDQDAALEIADRHRHTCVNPSGVVFRVRCFRTAPGCVAHGDVTDFYSWFAGYSWQIALCTKCAMHLGWLFSGKDPTFAGLIADRIEPEES